MSNYWNKLSPLHGTVTKRQSHATGGRVGLKDEKEKKNNRKRRPKEAAEGEIRKLYESPYHGRWSVSKETFEEAKKDVGDIKGKAHHLKAHKKEGKKRLKEIKKKSDYSPFYSEKVLKSAFPDRDKGWGGKHSRKIEHNANGGMMTKGRGPHGKTDEELLKEAYPGQFRNESNALAPKFHTKGRARGGFVKKAGGTKRVPGSGAATKGTNFEGIF